MDLLRKTLVLKKDDQKEDTLNSARVEIFKTPERKKTMDHSKTTATLKPNE